MAFRSARQVSKASGTNQSIILAGMTSGGVAVYDENTEPMATVNRVFGNGNFFSANNNSLNGSIMIQLDGQSTKSYLIGPKGVQTQGDVYFRSFTVTCTAGSFSTGDIVIYIGFSPG